MAEEPAAISMVNYFSSGTSAQLRGRNVFVQYSNHSQLKTDQSHSNAVLSQAIAGFNSNVNCGALFAQSAAAQAALQAAQALAGQSETQGGPNTVLRVIVEHMVYPVTLDVLFQVTHAGHINVGLFGRDWRDHLWVVAQCGGDTTPPICTTSHGVVNEDQLLNEHERGPPILFSLIGNLLPGRGFAQPGITKRTDAVLVKQRRANEGLGINTKISDL